MKALSIDETLAEAYAILGDIESCEWNWQGAEENFKRAIGLNQNSAKGHAIYAWYLCNTKRYGEALIEAKRAVELDPLWPLVKLIFSWALFYNHQYDDAIAQVNEVLSIDSTYSFAYVYLGDIYLFRKAYEKAKVQYQKAIALGYSPAQIMVALVYAKTGHQMKAREILANLKTEYIFPGFLALVYSALDEKGRAFEYLETAYEEHDQALLIATSLPSGFDPALDSLRADPRFQALVKKMGLEEIERRE